MTEPRPTPPRTPAPLTKSEEGMLKGLLKRFADRVGYEAAAELHNLSLNEPADPFKKQEEKGPARRKMVFQKRAKLLIDYLNGEEHIFHELIGSKRTKKYYMPTPSVKDEEQLLSVLLKKRYERLILELKNAEEGSPEYEDLVDTLSTIDLAFEDITGQEMLDVLP